MEHNPQQKENLKEQILKSIDKKEVTMNSRAHFVVRILLLMMTGILALLISIFLFSYIFFNVRISGRGTLLDFGAPGILPFLASFPWILLIIDIGLVGIMQWLARKFRFGYRIPVLYALAILLVISCGAGYLIDRTTDFNSALLHQADQDHLFSPFADLYENARRPPPGQGFCKCMITAIDGDVITAIDTETNATSTLTILVPPEDPSVNSFAVGDVIFVAGKKTGTSTIQAFGASQFPPGGMGAPQPNPTPGN